MALACKICIMEQGLKGSDIAFLPRTEEEFFDHMEKVHHNMVVREGETEEQAQERFLKKHPEALTCKECIANGAPWAGRS
jgi:hypothetical protein